MVKTMKTKFLFFPDKAVGSSDHLEPQEHEKENEAGKVKVGGEGDKSYDERKKAFQLRFSASKNAPPELGGEVQSEINQDEVNQRTADADRLKKEEDARKADSKKVVAERKGPGSNVPHIVEQKRVAEQQRDEFKSKVEEFEGKTKPALEKQIADLNTKIQSGDFTAEKEQQFQNRIVELEGKMKEKEDSLVTENVKLKKKLAYYDLAEDESFQEKYVQPVIVAHGEAVNIIGNDKAKGDMFHRALISNAAALRAQTPEQRIQAEKDRDDVLANIVDGMNQFSAGRFTSAVNEYIRHSQAHAAALKNHETTTAKLREQAKDQSNQAYVNRLETWDKTFKATAENYKEDGALTKDEIDRAKELGYQVDSEITKSDLLASKVIVGQSSMVDAIDIVHKGRVYPALKAKITVLQKELKDRDELIKKLRGGSSDGGESQGGGEVTKKDKQTREEWQKSKFGANRPGLTRQ